MAANILNSPRAVAMSVHAKPIQFQCFSISGFSVSSMLPFSDAWPR